MPALRRRSSLPPARRTRWQNPRSNLITEPTCRTRTEDRLEGDQSWPDRYDHHAELVVPCAGQPLEVIRRQLLGCLSTNGEGLDGDRVSHHAHDVGLLPNRTLLHHGVPDLLRDRGAEIDHDDDRILQA